MTELGERVRRLRIERMVERAGTVNLTYTLADLLRDRESE